MNSREKYFLALMSSALNGGNPGEKPDDVSFSELYGTAARQQLLTAAFCAVNRLERKPDTELFNKWRTDFMTETYRNQKMVEEAEELTRSLSAEGVKTVLLKGMAVRRLYPEPAYRSMSDIDILCLTDKKDAGEAMLRLGYTMKESGAEYHDVYIKSRYTRIELHNALFQPGHPYNAVFEGVENRLVPAYGENGVFYMSAEDMYLYLICHAAKHYRDSGIGLRVLADVYVILKSPDIKPDRAYIDGKLASVGLIKFCRALERVSLSWLGNAEEDVPEAVENEFFFGNVYGDRTTSALRSSAEKSGSAATKKLKYYLSVIFLPYKNMKQLYPVLEKCPLLLPFCVVRRWASKLCGKRAGVRDVRRSASLIDKKRIAAQSEAFSYFGMSEVENGESDG